MALPAGISTATVTAGVPVTFSGGTVRSIVTIAPSTYLVHTATGTPLVDLIEETVATEGVAAQFTLPHTDQDGFQDEAGNVYKNWYYTATLQYQTNKTTQRPKVKYFQIAEGQTLVDLDLLPGGTSAVPYTAPVATVTSVNGQTGAVTVEGGGGTGTVTSTDITDSTETGRTLITATDADAARTAIGAGTSSLVIGTGATDALAGNTTFTKADVGLGNVDNTADAEKPVSTATQAALDAKVDDAEKGTANGVATLGVDGKVPAAQLPASSGAIGMNLIPGSYAILNAGAASNAGAGSAGTVYLSPAYIPTALSVTELWAYVVTAAAGSTVQLGYYTNNGTTFTRQTIFGTVDTSTTGAKAITGAWTLPAGVIWLSWVALGGTPTMRGTSTTPQIPGPWQVGAGNTTPFDDVKTLNGPSSQASLPASFTNTGPGSVANPVRFAGKVA